MEVEMRKFHITREVVETIEVEAVDDYDADVVASETPSFDWVRDIVSFVVSERDENGRLVTIRDEE
jgi:hypothetical protein